MRYAGSAERLLLRPIVLRKRGGETETHPTVRAAYYSAVVSICLENNISSNEVNYESLKQP